MGPSEDSFCRICSPIARLWGKKTVKNGPLRPICSRRFPSPAASWVDLARRPVSEVMVSPVPTVAADTGLRRVAAVLLDTGLPGLPVTDEAGVLSGFIARTDILRAVAADPPLDLWSGPAVPL